MRYLMIALLCLAYSASALSDVFTVRSDEWPPYNTTADAEQPGYVIEILQAALEPHGYTVDYQTMPWNRSLDSVRNGDFHAVVGAFVSDAPDFVFPEESVGTAGSTFYTLPSSDWSYDGVDSIANIRLGYLADYAYTDSIDEYLEEHGDNHQRMAADGGLANLIRMLMGGRIDAVIEDESVMQATLLSMGISADSLRHAGAAGEPEPIYAALSPAREESAELAEKISQGIREMREDGRLEAILERYGVEKWW